MLNFPNFDADRGEVMKRALEAGVGMINVGTDLETSQSAVALAHEYENEPVWATVGLHPTDCQGATLAVNFGRNLKNLLKIKRWWRLGNVVWITLEVTS